MDATAGTTGTMPSTGKQKRGKDQLQWSAEVWDTIDQAVNEEIMRSRMAAKFLQQVYVHKKKTNVDSDVVILPTPPDQALSVDETTITKVQEYSVQFKLTPAQMEAEGIPDPDVNVASASASQTSAQTPAAPSTSPGTMSRPHRASTAVSLSQRLANIQAQAEDHVIFNGQNSIANSPLFLNGLVQPLDTTLGSSLDSGLLGIMASGVLDPDMPTTQIVVVHPTVLGTPSAAPLYRENTLNAIAAAVSLLQGNAHYEGYAVAMHTVPFADIHSALPTTLIEPVEPLSSLATAGVFGTGAMPPFVPIIQGALGSPPTTTNGPSGLPKGLTLKMLPALAPDPTLFPSGKPPTSTAAVLYTGVVVSLCGNTMDLVRGQLDDGLDVSITFTQKDAQENYRFRGAQRLAFRLKDTTARILLLFVDC
jgi:hypothetical protein